MTVPQLSRDEIFLHFALVEVAGALRALNEVERLAAVRVEIKPHITRREGGYIFEAVRFALHRAGSASRVFWPPRNKERGEHMRRLVGLPDDHGLKDRRLRDHIEHLDERLDLWTAESPRPFMSIDTVFYDDFPKLARPRTLDSTLVVYDEVGRKVHVMGDTFDLAKLRRDLEDVREHIAQAFNVLLNKESNPPPG